MLLEYSNDPGAVGLDPKGQRAVLWDRKKENFHFEKYRRLLFCWKVGQVYQAEIQFSITWHIIKKIDQI